MARISRSRRISPRPIRPVPYPIPSYCWETRKAALDLGNINKTSPAMEKRDWKDATCSVCMEYPHNAVLLLCSSHDKGCRPYMCGTSHRHSNCLDQFKKAYTKVEMLENVVSETMEPACPLCRGQVKGWTVVEQARDYLNKKKRSCMQDGCAFLGSYKELCRHVKSEHPEAKPREVDPELEQRWRMLERERERQDVISTIRSAMPGSVVFGDYVIDMTNSDNDDDDDEFGGVDGVWEGSGRGGVNRSILYFFLSEGARLMRLHRGNRTSEGGVLDADASAAYLSDGVDEAARLTRGRNVLRSMRRRQQNDLR